MDSLKGNAFDLMHAATSTHPVPYNSAPDTLLITKHNIPPQSYRAGLFLISNDWGISTDGVDGDIKVLLFKVESQASGSYKYLLQYNPSDALNLSYFACQSVNISFAVITEKSSSHTLKYSSFTTVCVHGGKSSCNKSVDSSFIYRKYYEHGIPPEMALEECMFSF